MSFTVQLVPETPRAFKETFQQLTALLMMLHNAYRDSILNNGSTNVMSTLGTRCKTTIEKEQQLVTYMLHRRPTL